MVRIARRRASTSDSLRRHSSASRRRTSSSVGGRNRAAPARDGRGRVAAHGRRLVGQRRLQRRQPLVGQGVLLPDAADDVGPHQRVGVPQPAGEVVGTVRPRPQLLHLRLVALIDRRQLLRIARGNRQRRFPVVATPDHQPATPAHVLLAAVVGLTGRLAFEQRGLVGRAQRLLGPFPQSLALRRRQVCRPCDQPAFQVVTGPPIGMVAAEVDPIAVGQRLHHVVARQAVVGGDVGDDAMLRQRQDGESAGGADEEPFVRRVEGEGVDHRPGELVGGAAELRRRRAGEIDRVHPTVAADRGDGEPQLVAASLLRRGPLQPGERNARRSPVGAAGDDPAAARIVPPRRPRREVHPSSLRQRLHQAQLAGPSRPAQHAGVIGLAQVVAVCRRRQEKDGIVILAEQAEPALAVRFGKLGGQRHRPQAVSARVEDRQRQVAVVPPQPDFRAAGGECLGIGRQQRFVELLALRIERSPRRPHLIGVDEQPSPMRRRAEAQRQQRLPHVAYRVVSRWFPFHDGPQPALPPDQLECAEGE